MTVRQILNLAARYENAFKKVTHPQEWVRSSAYPAEKLQYVAHCLWLIGEIRFLIEQGKLEEARRSLGFIQGVLWALKLRTLDILQVDNRST